MRVHELAKKLGIENKRLLAELKRLGIKVKNHLSLLDAKTAELVCAKVKVKKSSGKKKAAKPKKAAVQVKKTKKKIKTEPKKKAEEKAKEKPEEKKKKKPSAVKKKPVKKASKPKKSPTVAELTGRVKEKVKTPPVVVEKKVEAAPAVKKEVETVPPEGPKLSLEFKESPTVGELAQQLKITPGELIKNLMARGIMATINQRLSKDVAVVVAKDFGVEAKEVTIDETEILPVEKIVDEEKELKPRSPVVTIMGHVDHGKTTLLDAIRQSKIAEGEAGEITQHIGAYEVELDKGRVVFLDTPGHEAFTSMRAHGAKVTDIVVLVVAADDGVMPQTVEAIDHARAAKVPILVAINKIDKPNVNPGRIKKKMTEYELVAEEWGGKTIFVNVSAKTGKGIDELLDMLLLEAEMLELKANARRLAEGTVIEAEIHKGKGPIAAILVQKGTLRVGDIFICGSEYGKVKAMFTDHGRRIKEAGPSTPVEVLGFSNIPPVGETFMAVNDEKKARQISLIRKEKEREKALKGVTHIHLEDLHKAIETGKMKELPLILKADVLGSVTAVKESLGKFGAGKVKIKVIHSGAGGINESDVILAAASNAIIFGFNVVPDFKAQALAEKEKVDIHIYRIIYELLDEVKLAMTGLLEPTYKQIFSGRAEVRQLFRLPKGQVIAGSYVNKGKFSRSNRVRIVRNGTIVHEGSITSLRRFKDDVKEVGMGLEFGIGIANFNDIKAGDLIESYHLEKIAPQL
ncbi:MAG: translation initiation factor IF-2 [Candidatus Ratteibacteria bacterium]|nr:translation initiation factor IF-2 [Candidatus Ratteibacteria bacterium]